MALGFVRREVLRVAVEPPGVTGVAAGVSVVAVSVARSIIRPISATLIASASRARAHAASTRSGPHRFDQPQQGVGLAHLGPRQRVIEHRGGVGADGGPVIGGEALEMVDVAQGVGGLLGREVRGVGDSTAGPCARMDLDELAAVEHPDQLRGRRARRPLRRSGCPGSSRCALATSM